MKLWHGMFILTLMLTGCAKRPVESLEDTKWQTRDGKYTFEFRPGNSVALNGAAVSSYSIDGDSIKIQTPGYVMVFHATADTLISVSGIEDFNMYPVSGEGASAKNGSTTTAGESEQFTVFKEELDKRWLEEEERRVAEQYAFASLDDARKWLVNHMYVNEDDKKQIHGLTFDRNGRYSRWRDFMTDVEFELQTDYEVVDFTLNKITYEISEYDASSDGWKPATEEVRRVGPEQMEYKGRVYARRW